MIQTKSLAQDPLLTGACTAHAVPRALSVTKRICVTEQLHYTEMMAFTLTSDKSTSIRLADTHSPVQLYTTSYSGSCGEAQPHAAPAQGGGQAGHAAFGAPRAQRPGSSSKNPPAASTCNQHFYLQDKHCLCAISWSCQVITAVCVLPAHFMATRPRNRAARQGGISLEEMCWLNSLRLLLTVEIKLIVCTCPVQSPLVFHRNTKAPCCAATRKGDRNAIGAMRV